MQEIIQMIENSNTLNTITKANNRTRKFQLLFVLYILLFYFSKDTRLIKLWPILETVYIFVVATSITKEKVASLTKSTLIGLLTTLIVSALNTRFSVIYGIFVSIVLTNIYVKTLSIKLKSKKYPMAVVQIIQELLQELLTIFAGLFLFSLISRNVMITDTVLFTLLNLLASLPGILMIVLAVTTLWISGYHGATIVNKVIRIAYMQMLISNLSSFINNQTIPFIGAETFYQWVMWVGGSGTTIGLAIALRYFSRNKNMKALGKSAINSAVFNINEEILFGLPVVHNKHYLLPFILAPVVNGTVVYTLIKNGFMNYPLLPISWVIPGPVGLFISSLFDYRALLAGFMIIGISFIIYLPFVLTDDKKRQIKEAMS